MCGIVAILSKNKFGFNQKDCKIFQQMLFVDTLRGNDSTGVFGVNKYGSISVMKAALEAPDFLKTPSFKEFDDDMFKGGKIMVGHNRAATKGKVEDINAHPFTEGHITLVHNGTLWTHKHFSNKEVDSHAICELIATKGSEEALKIIDGAFALIWYDALQERLFITRNSKRPLGLVKSKDGNSIYIASEIGMMSWLLSRNAVEHDGKFLSFNEEDKEDKGSLFSFDLDTLDMERKEVEFYKPKSTFQHQGYYSDASSNWENWKYGYESETEESQKGKGEQKNDNPLVLLPNLKKENTQSSTTSTHGNSCNVTKSSPPCSTFSKLVSLNEDPKNLEDSNWWSKEKRRVIFQIKDLKETKAFQIWKIEGEFKGIKIIANIAQTDVDKLMGYSQLLGDVIQVNYHNDSIEYLRVANLTPFLYTSSKNNEFINSSRWESIKKDCVCDECGKEIGISDIPKTVIRFQRDNNLSIRRCVCEYCIDQMSKIGKIAHKTELENRKVVH